MLSSEQIKKVIKRKPKQQGRDCNYYVEDGFGIKTFRSKITRDIHYGMQKFTYLKSKGKLAPKPYQRFDFKYDFCYVTQHIPNIGLLPKSSKEYFLYRLLDNDILPYDLEYFNIGNDGKENYILDFGDVFYIKTKKRILDKILFNEIS